MNSLCSADHHKRHKYTYLLPPATLKRGNKCNDRNRQVSARRLARAGNAASRLSAAPSVDRFLFKFNLLLPYPFVFETQIWGFTGGFTQRDGRAILTYCYTPGGGSRLLIVLRS